jgi:hypothetical protein|tara:strand:- start:3 stop:203 length:201 start_codon:yes stop_codon:yes gene_type:complete
MLYYFAIYLGVGTILMLILEIFMKRDENYDEFKNVERIIGIVGWPIFLFQYFKRVIEIFRNKDDDE